MGSIPGMDACQSTNFKSLLSFPCSAPLRRHKSILYLFSAVSLPNPSDGVVLRKFRMRLVHMTTVNWNGCSTCSAWIRLGWLTDTAWTSRSRMRHNDLDFTTWTDMLELFCGPSQWLLILSKEIYNTRTFLICESQWNSLEGLLNC